MKKVLLNASVLVSLLFLGMTLYAQTKTIKGTVVQEQGEPLPGVTVLEKGTINGTVCDRDGNFSIVMKESSDILVFSFVGMKKQEVSLGNQFQIKVAMETAYADMDEVIVVGYGTQKKSDIISSVISIKPESVTKVPSTDIGEMLRGKAPGVYITMGDAGPGSSSNILIRGKNSINGGNDPLVIADGVPVGGINDINPNDIISLEVLKDAAAQAIYGARASNGVILITTKRAESGKTKVDISAYYGVQTVHRNFDIYSGEEFAQLKREAYRANNDDEYLDDSRIFTATELAVLDSGNFVNWEDEILRIAPIQNYNLSFSTGTEKTKIYSSFNYTNQQGVIPGTDYQKATIRINIDQKINDWFKIGANTSWQISQNNDPGTGGTLLRSITTSPLGEIYNEDGTYKINPTDVQESFNPLLDIAETTNRKNDRNDIMNIFMDFSPIKGFNYRLNASRRSWNRKTTNYSTSESLLGFQRGGLGSGSLQFEDNVEWQLENILTYNLKKDLHKLGFTAVQSISEKKYTYFRNNSKDIPYDILGMYGLEAAEINTPFISANRRGLVSFMGRIQYDFSERYYLTVSARADASTVFGANNKWGFFPAAALGWNVYREPFMENIETISNLKLRASYGSVGNEAISPYNSQSIAELREYIFDDVKASGFVPGAYLPNPDLRWETSTTLNTAIDFGLFKNRLTGTFEFYNTRTSDLLVDRALNADLGYTKTKTNIGEIENMGMEFSLNGVIVSSKDWKVNAGVQVSRNRNKIISLYGEDADGDGVEDNDVGNNWFIGQPIDVYYQYMPVGIFQTEEEVVASNQPDMEPGDIKLYDRDEEDGELNADDRVITQRDPKWYGSFSIDLAYKGFDLSADVLTVQGVIRDNPFLYGYSEGGSLRGIFNGVKQDYWTPENTTGNWPRPSEANDRSYLWTMGLQDASYVRLQNVTIGYTLPKLVLKKMKMERIRIYCTGHNLFTITDFQSYSPEKSPNDYPEAVSLIGGVQITF